MSYVKELLSNRYAMAALSIPGLQQPALSDLAWYLCEMDAKRQQEKGKAMGDDHLKQEAVKWKRKRDLQRAKL